MEAVAAVHAQPGNGRVEAPHQQRVPRPQVAGLHPVHGRQDDRGRAQDIGAQHVSGRFLRVPKDRAQHVQQGPKGGV